MATLLQAEGHRSALADLTTLALADLVAGWRTFDLGDAAGTQRQLTALLADLADGYTYTAGGMAAEWYDEIRAEAGAARPFRATVAAGVAAGQVDALAGWGVAPLYGVADPDAALTRLGGGLQRLVTDADRETVTTAARRDPATPRFYRYASATACAFCAMLASRGPVYRTEADAMRSHNYCRCFAVPVFPGETPELPSYYGDFADDYSAAAKQAQRETGARNAKPTLSALRRIRGTR